MRNAHNFIDLSGVKFNLLSVVKKLYTDKNRKAVWLCKCDCGKLTTATSSQLKKGAKKSCGCLKNRGTPKHSKSGSKEEKSYYHMRGRCYLKTDQAYNRYGGRGITVCDRWLGKDGFIHFLEDMGDMPKGYQLERMNNEGNYSPDNCCWATRGEQCRNRRSNKSIIINKEDRCLKEWTDLFRLNYNLVQIRLSSLNWPPAMSLFFPVSIEGVTKRAAGKFAKRKRELNSLKY